MTVKELMRRLRALPPGAVVFCAADAEPFTRGS